MYFLVLLYQYFILSNSARMKKNDVIEYSFESKDHHDKSNMH